MDFVIKISAAKRSDDKTALGGIIVNFIKAIAIFSSGNKIIYDLPKSLRCFFRLILIYLFIKVYISSMASNFINMEDKCLSKFVITSICIMTAILMFIITDSVYIFNAVAQTNETDIETNRIIDRQRTPSSGENPTDEVGNAPPQTNETDIETNETDIETNETDIETNRIIDRQRTLSSGENPTDEVGNAPPQTNETDIETNETDIETNETDIETNETDIETNETDIETNRIIIRQRTLLS
jgi:hypothetical protein